MHLHYEPPLPDPHMPSYMQAAGAHWYHKIVIKI